MAYGTNLLHSIRADQRNNQKHTIPVGIKASQQYLCILFMEIILIFIPFCINSLIFMIFLKLLGFSRYLFPPNMSRIHFLNTNKHFSEADVMTMVYISFPRIPTIIIISTFSLWNYCSSKNIHILIFYFSLRDFSLIKKIFLPLF